ncbi:MAG TPA: YbhB/YbcL family Raf kinase inhibitor-like protein, partial [Xanthomonadaceae bacterium]|nr:YbhB/YbcL family Raf kinase inhibitor-like protein [Xanthomonadaceae bacterium]
MRIGSDSFEHRARMPAEFAMGTPEGFGANRNPELHWDDAPAGTRSFALLCIDTDAPTDPATVG